jgi:hypothetical protein
LVKFLHFIHFSYEQYKSLMNQQRSSRPLAPVSGNSIKQPPTANKENADPIHAPYFMENRVTQYGESESDSLDFRAAEAYTSDSSYEMHMLEEMRQHQEDLATGRKKKVAFSRAHLPVSEEWPPKPRSLPFMSLPDTATFDNEVDMEDLLDWEERLSTSSSARSETNANKPFGWRNKPRGSWYERAKKGIKLEDTPQVQDNNTAYQQQLEQQDLQDSPLSHKSSAKGTPANAQTISPRPFNRIEDVDMSTFSAASMLESTPAYPKRKYNSIKEAMEAEKAENDASQYATPLPTPAAVRRIQQDSRKPGVQSPTSLSKMREALQAAKDGPKSTPQADREDTRNLLRLLSRSASKTPSPVHAERKTNKSLRKESGQDFKKEEGKLDLKSSLTEPSHKPSSVELPPQQRENRKSVSREQNQPSKAASQAQQTPLQPKTPKPIGAWVDTPGPSTSKSTTKPQPQQNTARSVLAAPKALIKEPASTYFLSRPKSALAAIIGFSKEKSENEMEDMGDATINSLKDIMEDSALEEDDGTIPLRRAPTSQNIVSTTADQEALQEILEHRIASELPFSDREPASVEEKAAIRDIVEKRILRSGVKQMKKNSRSAHSQEVITPRRKERMEEQVHLQRMTDRVNSLGSYTASMRAGLKRLERSLNPAAGCGHCDCPGNCFGAHPFSALARAILRAFVKSEDGKFAPTWFGIMACIMFSWLFLETSMCMTSCRPIYSSWNDRPFGPFEGIEPPYMVISWLSWPFGSFAFISRGLYWGLVAPLRKFFLELILESIGNSSAITKTTSQIIATATSTVVDASDWGIPVEEYL